MKHCLLRFLAFVLVSPLVRPAMPLEELAQQPNLWPAEVIVTALTKATLLKHGRPAGLMLVGAGKKLTVSGIAADGVTGKLGGTTVKVAVDKTDLMRRLDPSAAPAEEPATVEETAPAPGSGAPTAMQRRLSGQLVQLTGDKLQPVPDSRLAGVKYFGLYYSAGWCGPCREFTPAFINTYRQIRQKHPEFEVVFISSDDSAGDMRDYMKTDRMPWTALKYDVRQHNPELMRYGGPGIPCLVLVDGAGRVLADSYDGDNYIGPGHVLRETIRLLGRGR